MSLSAKDLERVQMAYHEAAHAVVLVAALGERFERVELFDPSDPLEGGLGVGGRVNRHGLPLAYRIQLYEKLRAGLGPPARGADPAASPSPAERVDADLYAAVFFELAGIAAEYEAGAGYTSWADDAVDRGRAPDPEEELRERADFDDKDVVNAVMLLEPLGVPLADAFEDARSFVSEPEVWRAIERLKEELLDRRGLSYAEAMEIEEVDGIWHKKSDQVSALLRARREDPA